MTLTKKKIKLFLFLLLITQGFILPFSQTAKAQDADPTQNYFEISKSIEIFKNLFTQLNKFYVDPIEPGKMTKTGLNSMLAGLDPYTNFFTEADAEDFRIRSDGEYGGVGMTTIQRDSIVVVGSVFEKSPAAIVGLHPGDIIISINGTALKGKSLKDLQTLTTGSQGTPLKMTVKNPITGKESVKNITRAKIRIENVPFSGLLGKDNSIAYVKLNSFMGPASASVTKALDSLKKVQPNLKGVILDLRGNGGGLLMEAVRICNLFLPANQLIVSTKGKDPSSNNEYRTSSQAWNEKIPLAVLVNHGSASASEIVSGTIQDLDRGVIIGTQSFGKGLVQQVKSLGYNTQLKVTVAHYYTPSGRCIQALDYAHRNPDGSVSKVPEKERNSFKTKNNRIVKDGGGIEPDIYIPEEDPIDLIMTLTQKHFIFDYATQYYYKHPTIAPAKDFKLNQDDFNDFINWLKTKNYSDSTSEGQILAQLKSKAEEEGNFGSIAKSYTALKTDLDRKNESLLSANQDQILKDIANEIVGRYYYDNGKAINRIYTDDPTIKKALEVLNNPTEYNKILK